MSEKHDEKYNKYFIEENCLDKHYTYFSPSKKYTLVISSYKSKEECWNLSRGIVMDVLSGKIVADVKRNYHTFWYCFSQHPNGHEYLLCGEDYQGQTIIELDTGKRIDYLPPEAEKGFGFCWVECQFYEEDSPPKLYVEGCIWACPFEDVTYDFSDPMNLPYKEKSRKFIDEE